MGMGTGLLCQQAEQQRQYIARDGARQKHPEPIMLKQPLPLAPCNCNTQETLPPSTKNFPVLDHVAQ